jgi:hypothetical protein
MKEKKWVEIIESVINFYYRHDLDLVLKFVGALALFIAILFAVDYATQESRSGYAVDKFREDNHYATSTYTGNGGFISTYWSSKDYYIRVKSGADTDEVKTDKMHFMRVKTGDKIEYWKSVLGCVEK